jgi:hypothetical protein
MMIAIAFRTFGSSSAVRRVLRRKVSNRERGWQDKRPRCAAMDGCGFSMGCEKNPRCVQSGRSLRTNALCSDLKDLMRCAGFAP